MTETMAEGCASAAACMLSPRIFTSLKPSWKLPADKQPISNDTCMAQRRLSESRKGARQAAELPV